MNLRVIATTFALTCLASQAAASNACTTPANVNAMASEIAAGVNANRRANGQPQLAYNAKLSQAAMKHACDMSVTIVISPGLCTRRHSSTKRS